MLDASGGIYFRDEGDCIVALFSDYFQAGATHDSVEKFCMRACANLYGDAQLSAKAVVATGDVAYFQKAHEVGSEDWSAEGGAFVKAVRLEAAADSKRQINFFRDDYDKYFSKTNIIDASSGGIAKWYPEHEKRQVPGLGFDGGWTDITVLKYIE